MRYLEYKSAYLLKPLQPHLALTQGSHFTSRTPVPSSASYPTSQANAAMGRNLVSAHLLGPISLFEKNSRKPISFMIKDVRFLSYHVVASINRFSATDTATSP